MVVIIPVTIPIPYPSRASANAASETRSDSTPTAQPELIELTPAKSEHAAITTERVATRRLRLQVTVPGRLTYDRTRHVVVRAATAGTIREIRVKPGDAVSPGSPLAIVDAPAVGTARADVLARDADWQLAKQRFDWHRRLKTGVTLLIEGIQSGGDVEQIHGRFRDQTLGEYGGQLLQAFEAVRLADRLVEGSSDIAESGAISERVMRERRANRRSASAALRGLIEQTRFELLQNEAEQEAAVEDARRRLRISRAELARMVTGVASVAVVESEFDENDLARVTITASIAGTVEARRFSVSERFDEGDELFTIADTTRLWVEADIRGGQWDALQGPVGERLSVRSAALPDRCFQAELNYVGRMVEPISGTVPLVAAIANPDGLLKPGMFLRVEVPFGPPREGIAVPSASVIDLRGQPSVFLKADGGYRPRAVTVGPRFGDRVAVKEGLRVGDEIVVEGAFVLKSELLLTGEN